MARFRLIKRIAALVLLVSFFLPLYQCTFQGESAGDPLLSYDISAFSAYSWPSVEITLAAFLFGWAAVLQMISFRRPTFEASRRTFALEVVLSLLAILGISWLIHWTQTIRYGAFVAYAAILAYLIAAIAGQARRAPP